MRPQTPAAVLCSRRSPAGTDSWSNRGVLLEWTTSAGRMFMMLLSSHVDAAEITVLPAGGDAPGRRQEGLGDVRREQPPRMCLEQAQPALEMLRFDALQGHVLAVHVAFELGAGQHHRAPEVH